MVGLLLFLFSWAGQNVSEFCEHPTSLGWSVAVLELMEHLCEDGPRGDPGGLDGLHPKSCLWRPSVVGLSLSC